MRLIDSEALMKELKTPVSIDNEKASQIWEGWHECTVAVKEAIDRTPSYHDGWIPCEERLPEKRQEVLVTVNTIATYTSKDEWTGTGFWAYGKNVLAWMPLPEPWKGQQP